MYTYMYTCMCVGSDITAHDTHTRTHTCMHTHSSLDPLVLWDKTLYLNLILHEVIWHMCVIINGCI